MIVYNVSLKVCCVYCCLLELENWFHAIGPQLKAAYLAWDRFAVFEVFDGWALEVESDCLWFCRLVFWLSRVLPISPESSFRSISSQIKNVCGPSTKSHAKDLCLGFKLITSGGSTGPTWCPISYLQAGLLKWPLLKTTPLKGAENCRFTVIPLFSQVTSRPVIWNFVYLWEI